MSIMWRYLDKRSATIAAIKDYGNMKFIITNSGEEIAGAYEGMAGVNSPGGTACRRHTIPLPERTGC